MQSLIASLKALRKRLLWREIWFRLRAKRRALRGAPCIFFLATPTHGNLGDQAIVYAQKQFFRDLGCGDALFEVEFWQYELFKGRLAASVRRGDLLVIDGGGNLGTLWRDAEDCMRDVVARFPDNPVVIFPQTAYFSDDEHGRQELETSRRVYSAHRQLLLFVRDAASFELLSREMEGLDLHLTPDIAAYIRDAESPRPRRGALLCLRADREKTLGGDAGDRLVRALEALGLETRATDTVLDRDVFPRQRDGELRKKWAEFSGARLVVTDRLHGMLFSAITATPCVALDNVSHKVRGGYAWLRHLPYIRYCDSVDAAVEAARELSGLGPQTYDRTPLLPRFEQMQALVKGILNENTGDAPWTP